MNAQSTQYLVRPNRPLREPAPRVGIPSPSRFLIPNVPEAAGSTGVGFPKPASIDDTTSFGLAPPALTAHFCNYCGQQGIFRCKRCKKTSYCSVGCQTKDWKAHRHVCKTFDQETAGENHKEHPGLQATADLANVREAQDSLNIQRIYLKDLNTTKYIKGAEIQGAVVEFYSPGRFFIHPEDPKVAEALMSITAELKKNPSFSTGTPYVPCVGEICSVQFSCDLTWYRGLIQTLAADQKTAHVLYIDYGNEENVPVERIKPLSIDTKPFCPCAMECQIAGVVPVVGSWSSECCMTVRQLLSGKTLTIKLVDTLKKGYVHTVEIQLSIGKQLSTFLLEQAYAFAEADSSAPTEKDTSKETQQPCVGALLKASVENFQRCSEGKDNNEWAQPPEPLTQAVGDRFSVVVSHFQSPNDFIVQKVENAGVIQDLQMKLREHCSQVETPQNFRPAPGTVCCAQFSEDKQWYRAQVLAYSSEKSVCVGYLDFGNSEEVDLNHLRPISPSLLALQMQAIPCCLAGVQPVGESWSEECISTLLRIISNKMVHMEIQSALKGKALVAIIEGESDSQINVAELLISANYAAPLDSNALQQTEETTNSAELPAFPTVCEPLVWSNVELPCDGQTVALLASVVKTPGEFYCCVNSTNDHQMLMELGVQLKQHCESDTRSFRPKVGEPCCVKFSGDGYRAMVKELLGDVVNVTFVDFGHNVTVDKSCIRSITPKLLKLPFQAVRCWLTGVEPPGSEWKSEALLWFQNLMDGVQLLARVVVVSEQGYGVELETGGQSVAAALISQQFAKPSGNFCKDPVKSFMTKQEDLREKEQSQACAQASNETQDDCKEAKSEEESQMPLEVATFSLDWNTAKLPLNETFQPCVAAVINPSLFYLLHPIQVDQQKLQEVMLELALYCSNYQSSSCVNSRPVPGAACCAQFSVDKNWYRAVILEVGEAEMSVVYADYGNSEKVPVSQILPIPRHLLQLPFQIIRCTLTGNEHFPVEWPPQVQQMFQTELLNNVMATVQSFDGSANVLSLSLSSENGGRNLATIIQEMLHVQSISSLLPDATQRNDQACSSVSDAAEPDSIKLRSTPKPQNKLEDTPQPVNIDASIETQESTPQKQEEMDLATPVNEDPVEKMDQRKPPYKNESNANDLQGPGCCCESLKKQMDRLEKMIQLLLNLQAEG